MGGLSSGPGPGLCLLTLVVLIVAQQVQSAPVQEEHLSPQPRAQGYYDGSSSELSTGCYYNFQHYGEGDRIITNEPCLNCTCHNRMLMCYLRVCPFTKAIGQNCTIEKKPGQCCPLIICPEVPVQLLTSSTTTEHSESLPHRNQVGYGQYGTAVGHLDDYGCKINGEFYTNGAQIPGNIDKPCEVCYCIRNRTACIMQECTLQVEGCIPVYEEGLCCPVRYQCDYEYSYNAITTEQPRPTPGLILTTTTSGPFECQHDNKWYADGTMVDTEDPCEHCYCMKGDIVCAVQECKPPFEKDGHNCTAMPPAPGKCCPDSYHCDGNEIVDESEPTFRQDRMHKFGQNNANVTMSITSSTSNGDKQHSWHYGTSSNENEMPNRFTDEHDKDGTTKPGKPISDSDMMVTEGVPPTIGPLESGSHHVDEHGGGSGMKPFETHTGMRPMEGQSSTGQGHGVNTDNMLTISQVIQSIVQNQTNLFNQNKFNKTGKPEKRPSQQDDKIVFPIDVNLEKKPGTEFQTDEDGNPIEANLGTTDFPNEYYGFTGSVPNIYAEHSGRPQKKPSIHKKPETAGTQNSAGQPVFGENEDFGGQKRPVMAHNISGGELGMTQHSQKKPIIHQQQGMPGTLVLTDDEGSPIEVYEGSTGGPEMVSGRPGSSGAYSTHGEQGRPQRPGIQEGSTGLYGGAQEGFTGIPDSSGIYSSSDKYEQPQKRPIIHKQPADVGGEGEKIMGPQDLSGQPGIINQPEIFGEHGHIGRPHKKPVTQKKPGATNDEMVTETYEEITGGSIFTGKPMTDEHSRPSSRPGSELMTDGDGDFHGKPQKRPGINKQPGGQSSEDDTTEGYETVTETDQDLTDQHQIQTVFGQHGFTGRPTTHEKPGLTESSVHTDTYGKPVTDSHGDGEYVYYDKYGKPHKRPVVHGRPGVGSEKDEVHLEGTTELPEGLTQDISGQDELAIPAKKPQIDIKPDMIPQSHLTDEDGNPIEEIKEYPEQQEFEIFYDKYGRPHKRPVTHKKPIEGFMTDKNGKPVDGFEGITDAPEGQTGKPEDQNQFVYYDQYGRPHKRPVTQKKPGSGAMTDEQDTLVDLLGITEFPDGFTGKPGTEAQQIYFDEHGRPHKRPISGVMTAEHGKPVDGVGVTDFPEGFTGKPGTDEHQIYYDEYGRPHKRPVTHEKPGFDGELLPDDHDVHGVTDLPEGFSEKPDTEGQQIFYDEHGRPNKRPITHKKPGQGVMTDEHGKPIYGIEGATDLAEGFTGKPETEDQQIFYDEHGRPHKKPVIHKKPGQGVMTDEHGKPVDGVEGVTDFPEGFTGKPETEDQQIFYDEHGRPHKRPVIHKKPGQGVMTDEHGKPVDGVEGVTDFPEGFTGKPGIEDQQVFYDEHGRPYKRPITHKKPVPEVMTDEHSKPVSGVEGVTDFPEGFTGKPGIEDQQIFYDEHGRPYKRPITHKKPVPEVMTDEHSKPVSGVEGVTDFPEGFTGKPGIEDQQIFYGEHGRPHKRPIIHKKPGLEVMTDEHGKPVDGVEGVTDFPEGFTGKPGIEDQQVFYDEHGRPHKRPIIHKKPGLEVMTDEHGKPVDGVEGVTDLPEGFTGKPGFEDQQIFYDEHGRPYRRPITHKKPVPEVMTDEHGKPVGVEGVTDFPEGFTGKPETEDQQIFYDEHGRPHKRPVIHKKPVPGVMTVEHGKPVDGVEDVTDVPESFTGKPGSESQQIYYDEHGRPHKRPISGLMTDEQGKPVDGTEGVTEFPGGFTGKPGTDHHQIFYDQHGRPHKRPTTHQKPGVDGEVLPEGYEKPLDGVAKYPEGHTQGPEHDDISEDMGGYGHTDKPDIKPSDSSEVSGAQVVTEGSGSHTVDLEEITGTLGNKTHGPSSDKNTTYYGEPEATVRPHMQPETHDKPDSEIEEILTDEGEMESYPGMPDISPFDDANKGTGIQDRPGQNVMTDEKEQPLEIITKSPEEQTDRPGTTGSTQVLIDQHTGTHKRPVSHKKPGENATTEEPAESLDVITEIPESLTGKPESDSQLLFYDQFGRPQKKPASDNKPAEGVTTDEHGQPVDGVEAVTDFPEGYTGKPGTDEHQIFYDQNGRPYKRPITHKKPVPEVMTDEHGKPVDGTEDVTDVPESFTGKPGGESQQIYYDEHGHPHKRPVIHKKPVPGVMTDEHGKPVDGVEGVTDFPEGYTGEPGTDEHQIFYDQNGRPYKRPITHKKPVPEVMTDEHGKPVDGVEGVTDFPEGFTGKPGIENQQVFYDEHGRPHKRPIIHKKPGLEVMTDEHGKPVDGVEGVTDFPEGFTGKPGIEDQQIFYDEHGRPYKRPIIHKKPVPEVMTDEHGKPIGVEGVTDLPEGFTGKPVTDDHQIFYDEYGRPHKRPVSHKKPVSGVMTDEHGKPVDGVEGVTDFPESFTGTPGIEDQQIFYDEHGRPHKIPGMDDVEEHELPQEVPQPGQTQEGADYGHVDRPYSRPAVSKEPSIDFTESLPEEGESSTKHPNEGIYDEPGVEQNFFGETGRPQKKPVLSIGQKHPSTSDNAEDPVHTHPATVLTENGEQIFYDEHGHPLKKPEADKQPSLTDEAVSPFTGVTESADSQTDKPESDEMEILYDKYGKPHKRPVSHSKPDLDGAQVLTDETDQRPVEKDTTETPEAATLEKDKIGQTDQKDKKPEGQMKPDLDGTDEKEQSFEVQSPDKQKEKPGDDTAVAGHGQDGLPQKLPDPYAKPGTEEVAEKEPDREEVPQIYGEHGHIGRPQKIPNVPGKPGMSMEKPMTEEDESLVPVTTELPVTEPGEMDIIYDKYGRPHKRPVTDKKPEVTAGEHVQPDRPEGITEMPESLSGKPETDEQQTYYDPYGRPYKKPVIQKKPGETVMTNEHDLPVEGVEVITESLQTEKPEDNSQEVLYDGSGRPYKKPVVQKKPGDGEMIGEVGKPPDKEAASTESPEEYGGKPGSGTELYYDQNSRPHKKPEVEKTPDFTYEVSTVDGEKMGEGNGTLEKEKPAEGDNKVTKFPEGVTSKPDSDTEEIFYDELGQPHKRPITHKKPDSGVMTDEHDKPVDGVEDVTEFPVGFTGKPGTDDQQIFYDKHGRPHKRPVTQHLPGVDGEVLPEEHEKPLDGVTKYPEGHVQGPEHDDITEIMIGYGHTGKPDIKPSQFTPGPEGISITEEAEFMTKSPDSSTSQSSQTEKPEDVAETYEQGKPLGTDTELLEEQTKEPGYAETSEVYDEHDENARPQEKPHSQTKPFTHRPEVPSQEHEQPEQEDNVHPVFDDQKPSDHWQPGVTEDDETATVENLTETPDSGNGDQPMIFGEHGHSGRPHKRPVTPTVPATTESENVFETSEGKPGTPLTSQKQDVPVDEGTIHKIPDSDKKKPQLASDGIATTVPENATAHEKGELPHQKPDMEDSQPTETSDKGITEVAEPNLQKKPVAHPNEETGPVEKRPEIHTSEDSVTDKLGGDSTEIYYDNLGRPHKRPVHTRPIETDKMPEIGLTGPPTISIEHGLEDDQHILLTTNVIDGSQTTEGAFHEKPDEMPKPGSADENEKKPEFDGGELASSGEPERPHKKPMIKPGLDVTGIMVDETREPEIGIGVTEKPEAEKPDVHHEEMGTGEPSKRPTMQEVDEGIESTTKLSSSAVHDTKTPDLYDGQTPVHHKPEENEIFGLPEKDVTGVDDGSVIKLPEAAVDTSSELSEPQKKPTVTSHESEDSHTGSSDLLHQYPQEEIVTSKTPEGDHPNVGHDTTIEDDDESLIITTDESGEDVTEMPQVLHEADKKPESDAEEKPLDTATKIPSHIVPGQVQQRPTASLDSQSNNFTSLYGPHDASGVPVTVKDGVAHLTTGKPDEDIPEMSTGLDEESKPDDVTTLAGISEALFPTTEHVLTDKDHAKPIGEDMDPALTGSTPISADKDDESPVPEKDLHQGTSAGTLDAAVSHEDTHPNILPSQVTDGVTNLDASVLPEAPTPVSTPEETHGVSESAGNVPSDEVHSVISSTTETPGKVSETKPAPHQPPQIFIPYLPPDDGSSTKHPILIDEGLHESSAPFDDILNNLANILRPSQTTEETVGTTEDHGEVPGEGSCFMDGVTYQNNEDIPPLSPCHTKCTCISSIIHCLSLKCPPPPEDVSHCTVVHEENSCCPIYVCGTDVSPTFPVENHEGETTTESTPDKDESATVHDYKPSKPTKPLAGVTSQKPELSESEDSSPTDQHMPLEHETDDKNFQASKPGAVNESKKPQIGGEVPEESDKGTPLTEKPEEDSVDESHTSSKPQSTGIETSTQSKIPIKTSEHGVTPDTSHVRPGEPQSGYHPISFGSKHPSTILPIYFGTEKPELPYQSHHKPESVDHVLDTDKPDQQGTEEPPSVVEIVKPHGDKQKPVETHGSKPDDFVEPTTYRPVQHETMKPVKPVGGFSQEDKTPGEVAGEEGESLKPGVAEKETEPSELHEHDETETDVHSTPGEQEPNKKPVVKPDEITPTKGKPQDGQKPVVTGEELEHQTTETPGEKKPQIHVGTTLEETVNSTFKPHDKPAVGVKPSYLDETLAHTTEEPDGESPETEESFSKPQLTDEPESNFVQSSSEKPELYDASTTPDRLEEPDPSIKRPVTHEKPSEEGEVHKQTSTLDTNKPIEVLETQKPGKPILKVNETETVPTEGDVSSTDKTHAGFPRPTYDTIAGGAEPHKKPDETTVEPDEILGLSTSQSTDQSESGKPLVPSGETTDIHKKQQPGHDGDDSSITSEGPHKESPTDTYPSTISEDSANITTGPQEETPEEFEDVHEKHPSVHPTSMDNESAFTTEEPLTEDKKPQGKPETEVYPALTDDKFSTTKPHEEPSEVEQSQTKPGSEEGLVVRPTEEGSVVKKPIVSENPVLGEKVPLGEQETGLVHSTTESQMNDRKPGETKPQHAQGVSSTMRPKPTGVYGVSGQDKPENDDIPEEVLLHPTRMPGTYETKKPDHIPDVEEDDTASQRPHIEDESAATIFPEGIIRPITKRPIYGTVKPIVTDHKESTTPGYPFVQLKPQISQGTGEPEGMFEVTAKPVFDIMTDVPEDFAQIFGIKPSTVHDQKPDKYDKPEQTTHFFVSDLTTRVPDFKPQTTDHAKRPIHTTNGTHFIQYVPYKEGEVPLVPEGAALGELVERPDGGKYWPVIYMKRVTTTPGAEIPQRPFKPIPQQVFNGTHFIQYVPYDDGKEPEVPEGTNLGQPQKGPDGQIYWPIIGNKPIMSPEDKPTTEEPPLLIQVFNGTNFIQYVPFKEGQKPEVPEDATLGELETTPNGQKFWPIISNRPIAEDDSVTSQRPLQPQPEQIFNGTHFIQFAPYNDGQEPEIPEEATLGQPQKGPDGQIYWPIIDKKPLPLMPDKFEPTTEQPLHSVQVFNGTNLIQYVPFKEGVTPEVPEGATLGQPQKGQDNQMYWPIIYMKPRPVTPQGSFPEQVYNGTNFIQYVPYKDGHKPEVPSHATLGQPQKAPDGQMYWPIIYTTKPITPKPEDEITSERPSQAPIFNGTHFIQYVPYMEGFEPDIPEEATLGKPEKKPDGETYWPIIYQKLPTRPKPETVPHYPGQFFNGTHFVQYLPYRPNHKPHVPEGVIVSQPQKGPDGQMYWMIVSTKPLPTVQAKPTGPQFFNGTHFIQYVPYEIEKKPEVPEGATLGKPETGIGGQKFWPIIYMKPIPDVPITHQKPLDLEKGTYFDPYKGQVFNGTHYIQYVPYVPGKTPNVPKTGVLGQPTKRPDGQLYWPIIFQRPVPGVPVAYEDQMQTFDPILGPIFNGTHYVQYVPYKPGERPILPEGATLGQPTKRPNGQLYWPIYYIRPVQETPTQRPMPWSPYDDIQPQPEQVYNGTHFIQYLPYNPTRMPAVPEGATLGQPQKGPEGQMYWVIISDRPLPAETYNDTHVVQYVTPVTPGQDKPQTDENKPIQVFNGSHYIQYVPYTPGQKPVLPEGASLGQPTKGPEGQMYWPIIYMKPHPGKPNQQEPIFWGPGHDYLQPVSGQIFNGTHYIRFIKYDPGMRPIAPEGATISEPQRRPDGQLYWMIASKKPLSDVQVPFQHHPGQIFNGTHYIQYVPYNSSQMPQVPEGAILGHPQKGPEGQMYWVIISDKPLPAQPGTQYVQYVTPVTPEDDQTVPGTVFSGTHYIQYVPYKPGQVPTVPQDATLGELQKGPEGQMYWPIIYRRPPQSFNGTHYIQYVSENATGTDFGKPSAGTHHLQPVNATSKPAEDHPFWSYGQYAPRPGSGALPNASKYPAQKPGTEEHAFWTYGHDKPQNGSEDNYAYKPTTEYPSWSSGQIHNTTKVPEISKLPSGQYGGGDHSKPGYEYESGYYKPEKPERPSTSEDSYEAIDEDHLIEYPSGSDYDETQEQPYGPGTCRYAGKVYVSAQQIPRDDPCDFCFCFRSDIICLQQSCPPPIPGCHEEPIQGFCCPRYECHVRMATLLNVTSTTTTTTTTLPPHFLSHVYKGAAGRTGCFIQGKAYRVGQAIPSASGPCMDCMCGGDGKMKCEPKVCTPEPMIRQMMVSSEKPTTVNHR